MLHQYSRINPTKSPDSGVGNVNETNVTSRESAQSRAHVDRRVTAVISVKMPAFVCLRS